jgi:anti-anti-sigma factor
MQARINRHGEIVVVYLSGRVDVETAEPFREACLNQLVSVKVVFDFKHLSFVGSSGLLPFLETIQEFAGRNANGFKFCGVGSEFRRVFSSTALSEVQIFDSDVQAVQAFLNPPVVVPQAVEAVPVQPFGGANCSANLMNVIAGSSRSALSPSPVEAAPVIDCASQDTKVAG